MTTGSIETEPGFRPVRAIGLTLFGVVLALLIALPFPTLIAPAIREVLFTVGLCVGLVGWIVEAWRPILRTSLVAGLAAVVLVAVASAVLGEHPSMSYPLVGSTIAYSGTAVLAWRWLGAPGARERVAVVVGVGGLVLVAGSYVIAVAGAWGDWLSLGLPVTQVPTRPGGIGGWVAGPMWTSDYIALFAPIALAVPILVGGHGRRAAQAALAVLAIVALYVAAIRSLWLACLVVVLVLCGTWAYRRRVVITARIPAWLIIGAVLVGAIGIAAVGITRGGSIVHELDEGRLDAWSAATHIAAASPVLGAGPGSFATLRFSYSAVSANEQSLLDPHDGILSTLAQTGVVGLGALLFLLSSVVVATVANVRRGDSNDRVLAIAASSGLAIVALHRLVDIVFMIPGMMVASILVAGLAMGAAARADVIDKTRRWVARGATALILLAIIVVIPGLMAVESARSDYRVASNAWVAGDVGGAGAAIVRALSAAPDLVPARLLATMVDLHAGRAPDAVREAQAAVDAEPLAQSKARLALALVAAGRPDDADAVFTSVLAGQPDDAVALLNVAIHGRRTDRIEALTRMLLVDPTLGPLLGRLPADLDQARAVVQAVERLLAQGATDAAAILALLAGRSDLATSAVTGSSSPLGPALIAAWGGDPAAMTRLEADATRDPADWAYAAWLISTHRCNATDANRWAEAIRLLTGAAPSVATEVGPTRQLGIGDDPVRYPTWVWGVSSLRPAYPDEMWTIDRRAGVTCLPQPS